MIPIKDNWIYIVILPCVKLTSTSLIINVD